MTMAMRNGDVPSRDVATALTQESRLVLATSVRSYAKRSRAHGDSVQEVVKVLEGLMRESAPESGSPSTRAFEVAEWAIEAYFEAPASIEVSTWYTEVNRRRSARPSSTIRKA
jgi:hypothetical protein